MIYSIYGVKHCKTFTDPKFGPPRWSYKISEPLMGQLMCNQLQSILLRLWCFEQILGRFEVFFPEKSCQITKKKRNYIVIVFFLFLDRLTWKSWVPSFPFRILDRSGADRQSPLSAEEKVPGKGPGRSLAWLALCHNWSERGQCCPMESILRKNVI